MFTPEGYWSWEEVDRDSKEWTRQIVARSIAPEVYQSEHEPRFYDIENAILETLVSSGKSKSLAEARFALDLLELWVLANFMDLYEAVLCSPDGRILRCPPALSAHGDAFDWWVWPLSNEKMSNGEASSYFEGFRAGKFNISDARSRFVAVDADTGSIKLKPNTISLIHGMSYGQSLSDVEAMQFIDEQIRPVIGWSICWNEKVFPETEQDLFASLGFVDLNWSDLEGVKSKCVPTTNGAQNILKCVLTAYPNGKGTEIWSVVADKVGYSRRSIVRALKSEGRYDAWATGGKTSEK